MSDLESPSFNFPPQTRDVTPSRTSPGLSFASSSSKTDDTKTARSEVTLSLSLSAGDRIAPPATTAGGRGTVLSFVAVLALLIGSGAAYMLVTGENADTPAKQVALSSDRVAVAAVQSPVTPQVSPAIGPLATIETGSLAQYASQASLPAVATPIAESPPEPEVPVANPADPSVSPPQQADTPAVVAVPSMPAIAAPLPPSTPSTPKIINALPPTPSVSGPAPTMSAPPPRTSHSQAVSPVPAQGQAAPPVKATQPKPVPPVQKVARADPSSGAASGRQLPPVSDLPPATRPAMRALPSGLASESLQPSMRQASANSRDPVRMRAAAAGLHPQIPRDLLERLTPTDLRNAGTAVQTAVAEAPDGEVFVFPRERRADLATYQVRMLRAVHPECRRYVVTVTKDGWSTTAPPMENCEIISSRATPMPPPDGPPPIRY